MRDSIMYASFRSFFLTLFGFLGFGLGLIIIIILIGSLTGTAESEPEIEYKYTPEIQPNAAGIRKSLSSSSPVILKINIHGVIGLESLDRHAIERQLVESREGSLKDNRVKALLLHIDSPGGTVVDADGIYRAIVAYKEAYKVPVYAYVDGLCASGGFYIAAAADKVFASDTSLIGSVGVISPPFLNFSQLIEKLGVQSVTLYEGKGKDNMNPLRPWQKGEEDNLKDVIAAYYDSFVNIVTSGRQNLNKEKLIKDYGANIYPAPQAKEFGYIDESGYNLSETLKALTKQLGIEDEYYQVIQLENKNWISELFHNQLGLLNGHMVHEIALTPETNPKLLNQYLYLYRP